MNHLKTDVLKTTETTVLSPISVFLVQKVHFLWEKKKKKRSRQSSLPQHCYYHVWTCQIITKRSAQPCRQHGTEDVLRGMFNCTMAVFTLTTELKATPFTLLNEDLTFV